MKISKENNQYYGEYFERKVTSLINNEEMDITQINFSFLKEDIEKLNKDAEKIANLFENEKAIYYGRQTKIKDCDLEINGKKIELKYVGSGKGTYFNTSIEYFTKVLGFTSYSEYLKKYNVLYLLEQTFGESVYKNISPVSTAESSFFRHNKPKSYSLLQKIEHKARKAYVQDLELFFKEDNSKLYQFIYDMLTKNKSNKSIADCIIIFNYNTEKILKIDKNEILSFIKNKDFYTTDGGFVFKNFRIQLGWQNGTGLNNPTIRVFL